MSYPYLSDLFHALLHIDVYAPIPMFGIFVAYAVFGGDVCVQAGRSSRRRRWAPAR